ncbi:MAG: hypothetical protein KKH91_00105 [Elusimicrobia bacterium]|nr:hypothetical protein [Elusimicrobiota bacterium]
MDDKENLQNVLSELKKVLGGLTKEEKEQVVEKIEKKLGEVGSLFYPNTKVPVSAPDPALKQETQKTISIQRITPAKPAAPTAGGSSFKPIFREPAPSVDDVAIAQAPQIIKSKAEGVVVELPKQTPLPKIQEGMLKFACFYPIGKEDLKEAFISNLVDVFKKTSKKPITPESVLELGVDVFSTEWKDLISKCREKDVKVIFMVHPEGYDPAEIKNKILGAGIFFYSIPAVHINRKLTYVDLVIELILHKE